MRRSLAGLLAGGLIFATAAAAAGANAADGRKTRFAITLSGLALSPDTGDLSAVIGPGLLVDFKLGKSFAIAPEITLGFSGVYAGGMVNYGGRKFFVGAGGGFVYFWQEDQDIQGDGLLKFQAGLKGPRWLFTAAFVSNILSGSWLNGLQLTAGYDF